MIKKNKGDIFSPVKEGTITVICHQVNCKGEMGAGLAKQVKEKYPKVYEEYKEKCEAAEKSEDLLGACQLIEVEPNIFVANLFGQDEYGTDKQQTIYGAQFRAFFNLIDTLAQKELILMKGNLHSNVSLVTKTPVHIRIPYKMGCGFAGGNWEKVEKNIKKSVASKVSPFIVEIWNKE